MMTAFFTGKISKQKVSYSETNKHSFCDLIVKKNQNEQSF
jgi:hypothetical protein